MKALVRPISMTLMLGLLLAVTGLVGPQPKTALATVSTPVIVTNTPNVNVANTPTVNAQQAGPWNVGINGIPTVNVANFPPPLPPTLTTVVNMDDPGRIPYQSTVNMSGKCPPGSNSCFWEFGSVPAGHRVVIQHLSGVVGFGTKPTAVWVLLNNGSGLPVSTFLAPFAIFSAFDQAVRAYFDPGQLIEVQVNLDLGSYPDPADSISEIVTATGYELNCSIATCAAIAP